MSNILANHIKKLKASPKSRDISSSANLVFWGAREDEQYLPHLKPLVGGATVFLRIDKVTVLSTVKMFCRSKGITRIIAASPSLLALCLGWDKRRAPAYSSYVGSHFKLEGFKEGDPDIEVVFINPLRQLVTVPYNKMLTKRLITKLTRPDSWYIPTSFKWDILTPANESAYFSQFSESFMICIDIETFRENAAIRCLSYTGFIYDTKSESGMKSVSVVLPLDSDYALAIMRKWNWELKAPKVLQNGKYDISYLSRYNAPVYNYLYDTANMFHCWYAELPKDLGFLNSFFIREAVYWKDLAETNDLHEYYRYNALDTWGTGNAFLAMMLEIPDYAFQNYLLEFPIVFPCHMCEMTGIERDMSKLAEAREGQELIIRSESAKLNTILDIPIGESFNTNSPIQMKALLKLLGCSDLTSADAKNLTKARFRHPFNARLINSVIKIRKARKLVSTYLTEGKEFKRQDGTGSQILFSLNPHGTDTSRLASKEHHFWAGLQIQNIPRGKAVKQTLRVPDGWVLCEVDLAQAESRDTAYISGDKNLIENVEHSPDFHCSNAAAFFGIPFEEMYDVTTGAVLNKPMRQLGKPINHGANYNMGAYVLIDTMGEEKIQEAKKLLDLNRWWSDVQVAEYLLEQFHKTYPAIKGVFYSGVVDEILTTGMLSSKAWHHHWRDDYDPEIWNETYGNPKSWTRKTFGDPSKSKTTLNSYIAHPPQSLNAQTLNKAFLSVFKDISMNPKHEANFKLIAQVHDSILFRYRVGHRYLTEMVVERMQIPVTIKAYDGVVRTFVVPAAAEDGEGKATYWSEK